MSTFLKRHQKAVIWAIIVSFVIGAGGLISLDRAGVFDQDSTEKDSSTPTFAATVGGDKISLEALSTRATQKMSEDQNDYARTGRDPSGLFSGASGAARKLWLESSALSDLIRETIYSQEARSRGIKTANAAIDSQAEAKYQQELASYGITEDQLRSALAAQGRTIESLKAAIRASIATKALADAVDAVVAPTTPPTEEEIVGYFEANSESYDVAEEVHAAHILVADLATAEDVESQLAAGGDFAALAAQYSTDTGSKAEGGVLDWFGRGRMVPEFETAAFALKPGETSPPVKSQFGYHIIRVIERRDAHTATLAEVRDKVVTDLEARNQQAAANAWYTEARKAKKVVIGIPVVSAYMLLEQDIDLGLAEFERLQAEDKGADPYLPYYIGQIYEAKANAAASEQTTLEAVESPTPEQASRIAELKVAEQEAKSRALAAYVALVEAGQVDEGVLTQILSFDARNEIAILAMGRLLAERGDATGAQTRFQEVIAANPEAYEAIIASGDLAEKNDNYALAKQRYEQALALRAGDSSVRLKLITVLLSLGDVAGADAMTAAIRQTDPQNPRLAAAEADVAKARLATVVLARDALKAAPSRSATDETQLAALERQVSELYETAVSRYEAAIKAGANLDLSVKLGQTHLFAGKLDAAEKEFQAVLARSPYRADAFEGLAEIGLRRGQTEKALGHLKTALARSFESTQRIRLAEQIVKLDSRDTATRLRLAKLYSDTSRWSAAVREFDELILIDAGMEDAYSGIAKAFVGQGNYNSALDYLRRGVAAVQQAAAKIRLYDQIVETDQADVGESNPLSSAGLDALVEIAKLDIERGDETDARTRLTQVKAADPAYRAAEVADLFEQAGGASAAVAPSL